MWSAARSAKISMILCMPERVSGGDAKFQGFCDRWNKWEGQVPESVCDPHTILLHGVLSNFRSRAMRQLEIIAPRHQLDVLRRSSEACGRDTQNTRVSAPDGVYRRDNDGINGRDNHEAGRRTRWRISLDTPGFLRRDFHVQKSLNPLRCQPMTVSGLTITRAWRQPGHRQDRMTQKTLSAFRSDGPGAFAVSGQLPAVAGQGFLCGAPRGPRRFR